jgi:hypothetical protein
MENIKCQNYLGPEIWGLTPALRKAVILNRVAVFFIVRLRIGCIQGSCSFSGVCMKSKRETPESIAIQDIAAKSAENKLLGHLITLDVIHARR